MGCGGSKEPFIEGNDGNEAAYHNRFMEDRVLGEGQFGVVKMVHDMKAVKEHGDSEPYACKVLRKGITFKDNTLYTPLKPDVLKQECDILRTLAGEHYCLELYRIYETPRTIYMVTEMCFGGEMMEYVSKLTQELRTEDVSRIAYQLLDAVNHCATHGVIHRDIKPENVMFKTPDAGSDLRLIDYGSGCLDAHEQEQQAANLQHTTFAGSAFYISPEMFQKTYTSKTDVWSCGATLYVLVAGYPSQELQHAFNILQQSKHRDLRTLPNLPENMPDSFYDMLEQLMTYRHKARKSAGDMLQHEFVQFHKEHAAVDGNYYNVLSVEDIAAEAANAGSNNICPNGGGSTRNGSSRNNSRLRTQSIKISGSVSRHTLFLGYQKYERQVTTLLATLLTRSEFTNLLKELKLHMTNKGDETKEEEGIDVTETSNNGKIEMEQVTNKKKLSVIPMNELKALLKELGHTRALSLIDDLPKADKFDKFAYHVALLRQFDSVSREATERRISGSGADDELDSSIHSNASSTKNNSSVHGNNVFHQWTSGRFNNPRKKSNSKNYRRAQSMSVAVKNGASGHLDHSWHNGS